MGLKEIGFEGKDWIHLVQNRGQWRALVNTAINLRVILNVGTTYLSVLSFLGMTAPWREGVSDRPSSLRSLIKAISTLYTTPS
jgi:hypothetical protein